MQFWQGKRNANGHAPAGDSATLVTKNSADDVLSAGPAGTGGLQATFGVQAPVATDAVIRMVADDIAGADGSAVSAAPDRSGFNNAPAQSDPTKQPTLKTGANGINGHSVIRFGGSVSSALQSYLSVNLDPRFWTGLSVYFVVRTPANHAQAASLATVFGWPQVAGSWFNTGVGTAAAQGAGWAGTAAGVIFGPVAYADNTVYVASYRYDKSSWKIEGVTTNTVADTAWPTVTVGALIGSNTFAGSQGNLDIAEVIVYRRRLSDSEDAQNLAYLAQQYGKSAPTNLLRVGYPPTIDNVFCRRFAHPAGSDTDPAYDGKTWQTAKKTGYAAMQAAIAAAVSGQDIIDLHLHSGCYWGGPVKNCGIWINSSAVTDGDPGPGWWKERPMHVTMYGGAIVGNVFTQAKGLLYQGNPGDDQAWDNTKPLIWVTGAGHSTDITFRNIQPGAGHGFIRLGVNALTGNASGTRDGNLENVRFYNCHAASTPDTGATGTFGPAWDCGWISECRFEDCSAIGSATMRSWPVNSGPDGADASTSRMVFTNASFTSDWLGGFIALSGTASNNGTWKINFVVSATTVVVQNAGPGTPPTTEIFPNTTSISGYFGPTLLQADDRAGWLFKPSGSMGLSYFRRISTLKAGIKVYVGSDGEVGVNLHGFLSENGPMPHAVHIEQPAGFPLPPLTSDNTNIELDDVVVADQTGADPYLVWIDPILQPHFGEGTIRLRNIWGPVYGPGQWQGSDADFVTQKTTPNAQRLHGWFRGGRISGRHEAGRRIGASATALPSSSGAVGAGVTNLASHDPTAWTGPALHFTAGTQDIFGLHNAADIDALNPGIVGNAITFAANPSASAETWSDGDFAVVGLYVRALDGPLGSSPTCTTQAGGGLSVDSTFLLPGPWEGNADWVWCSGVAIYSTPAGTPITDRIILTQPSEVLSRLRVCYPIILHFKVSDGWTYEEVKERTVHLATWNPLLAQGAAGTMRKQPFVASGGIGVDSSVLVTPSGTAAQAGNLPILGADGTTVIAWVPTVGSNKSLAAPARDTFSIGPSPIGWNDGIEHVALEWTIDSGTAGATLTFGLIAQLLSASGTATFQLRIGGTRRTADGTAVLTKTQTATGVGVFAFANASNTATSPGGTTRLKLTVQSSGAGNLAQVVDGYVLVVGGG